MFRLNKAFLIVTFLLTLSACGGGGSDSNSDSGGGASTSDTAIWDSSKFDDDSKLGH